MHVGHRGYFAESRPLARPNLQQLEEILLELDIPDHDPRTYVLEDHGQAVDGTG